MHTFPYSLDNKRYHTLHYYNLNRYGGKVYKAGIDAGFSCPNRIEGRSGCIYCHEGSRYFTAPGTVGEQLSAEIARIHRKNPRAKIIAYFQAGTNTYAPADTLRTLWQEALRFPEVVGLSIATRADCLEEDKLALLAQFHEKTDLTVELGLQTIHDKTAERIGRGHNFEDFLTGVRSLRDLGIRTCIHIINGLPGENREMMLQTAKTVAALRPGGVKIHLLHVTEGTPLGELWRRGGYIPMEKEEYITLTAEQIRYFHPETVIERLTGDGDKRYLLSPKWSMDKISVLGGIDSRLAQWDAVQGDRYKA